jgi:hypothetical protein
MAGARAVAIAGRGNSRGKHGACAMITMILDALCDWVWPNFRDNSLLWPVRTLFILAVRLINGARILTRYRGSSPCEGSRRIRAVTGMS